MLWPMSKDGWMPHDIQSFASAYSTTKMHGWVSAVRLISNEAVSRPLSVG